MHTPSVVVINLLSYTLCNYLEKFSYFANSGLDGCDNFFFLKKPTFYPLKEVVFRK